MSDAEEFISELECKIRELEESLKGANSRIEDLKISLRDAGGCPCPKCRSGWGPG